MQPPILSVVRKGLIACVDDGAVELHPLVDVVDDVIRALADLKFHRRAAAWRIEIEGEGTGLPDAPCAGENLPSGEETEQRAEQRRMELYLATHEVIFMTAKSRAGVMIDVVLDERHAVGDLELLKCLLQD